MQTSRIGASAENAVRYSRKSSSLARPSAGRRPRAGRAALAASCSRTVRSAEKASSGEIEPARRPSAISTCSAAGPPVPEDGLDRLRERKKGHALAIRRAAADEHAPLVADSGDELADEPRLADTGRPDDRARDTATSFACVAQRAAQELELSLATDERCVAFLPVRLDIGQDTEQAIRLERPCLALHLEGLDCFHADRLPTELPRQASDEDLARTRALLEPSSDVHRVAGGSKAVAARLVHHDLAGVHSHADVEVDSDPLERLVEPPELGPELVGGPQRAKRVVLVGDRHAEERDDRVSDELLHRPSVSLHDRSRFLEVAIEDVVQRLRVVRLAEARRPDDVAEQGGHGLTLRHAQQSTNASLPRIGGAA